MKTKADNKEEWKMDGRWMQTNPWIKTIERGNTI